MWEIFLFLTSIFLPSTTVAWSCSLALSASEALANVTKPKPWKQMFEFNREIGRCGETMLGV